MRCKKCEALDRGIVASFKAGLSRRRIARRYRIDVAYVDAVLRLFVKPGGV